MQDEEKLTEADFAAADAVLGRMKNDPPIDGSKREALREYCASMHARFGAKKFELLFGLREPRNPLEQSDILFFQQKITEEEYKKRYKDYATRPVDLAMLKKFFSEYEAAFKKYGDVLQLIVEIATDQLNPNIWQRRERS